MAVAEDAKMRIEAIFEPYLFAVKYDGEKLNVFDGLFKYWNDTFAVNEFLTANAALLSDKIWKCIASVDDAAQQVVEEARELKIHFKHICKNSKNGKMPDLDSHFKFFGGSFPTIGEYMPQKSYGTFRPSLLRVYAIRLQSNAYLIVDGGIKLGRTIQESPGLKDHVLKRMQMLHSWLRNEGFDVEGWLDNND